VNEVEKMMQRRASFADLADQCLQIPKGDHATEKTLAEGAPSSGSIANHMKILLQLYRPDEV
jgi:hypothetical protein